MSFSQRLDETKEYHSIFVNFVTMILNFMTNKVNLTHSFRIREKKPKGLLKMNVLDVVKEASEKDKAWGGA